MPSEVDGSSPEQRIVEAAAVLPAYGGVTGWAALRWWGGAWFDGLAGGGRSLLPVTLAVAACDIRPQPGIAVSEEGLDPEQLTSCDGLRVTTVSRSILFEMRYARDKREAAVFLSMAAYSDLISIREAKLCASDYRPWTGIPQAREATDLADENLWSPWEQRMLNIWLLDAGLVRPLCNVPVFDRYGRHVGTPDLLDPIAGVVGEFDGGLHLLGAQRRKDRTREEEFRKLGLEYFTMFSADEADRGRMADRMLQVRERARFAAEATRQWTTALPAWWIPTFTVEQRRNLDRGQRELLLRLRRKVG